MLRSLEGLRTRSRWGAPSPGLCWTRASSAKIPRRRFNLRPRSAEGQPQWPDALYSQPHTHLPEKEFEYKKTWMGKNIWDNEMTFPPASDYISSPVRVRRREDGETAVGLEEMFPAQPRLKLLSEHSLWEVHSSGEQGDLGRQRPGAENKPHIWRD